MLKYIIPYVVLAASFLLTGTKSQSVAAVRPCADVVGQLEAEYRKQGRVLAFAKELMPGVAMAIYIDPATETQYGVLVVFPGGPIPSSESVFQFHTMCSLEENQGVARIYLATHQPSKI